jgi:Sel1 repeat
VNIFRLICPLQRSVPVMDSTGVLRTFKTALGVALPTLFLTASTICQPNSHPVSAKVKEMLLIQQAEKGDRHAQAEIVSRAEKGDPQAQAALGDNYEYGYWVAKDQVEALRWYQKAAEKGDRGAREILAEMYFDGNGVRRDFGEAAKWFGCPKPSEAILASCKETRYQDLPQGARGLSHENEVRSPNRFELRLWKRRRFEWNGTTGVSILL